MKIKRLVFRNLRFFWRTNLAVVAGTATAVAVLSGALLVGESVRGTLRSLVLQRVGNTDYALSSPRLFREDLAGAIESHDEFRKGFNAACPLITLEGIVIHEKTGLRAQKVKVYGVDDRFWRFHGREQIRGPDSRDAMPGASLARELSAQTGDTLLLRIDNQQSIPKESLFGRREEPGRTVRLTCQRILAAEDVGEFSLRPGQQENFSIFISLRQLQRDLQMDKRINAILFSSALAGDHSLTLERILKEQYTLQDLGFKLRLMEAHNLLSVESERILLEAPMAQAALEAAPESGMEASSIYTYLANSIQFHTRSIPYSVITAAELFQGSLREIQVIGETGASRQDNIAGDSIWLNEWAQRDLGVSVGDPITVEYYRWEDQGRLTTQRADFRVAGILAVQGIITQGAFAPDFPGITEAESLSDWDPPFPMDLKRIRRKDEEYWDRYKAMPKAFVGLVKGQELWSTRFGKHTSIRLTPKAGTNLKDNVLAYLKDLHARLDPLQLGFALDQVKAQGLAASRGATDFGQYFLYFSFFLIGAAILLALLFFKLGVEQRLKEIGTLEATGFSRETIRNIFLFEAVLLSVLAALIGLVGAMAYTSLLIFGLEKWGSGALGTQALRLHLSWLPFTVGGAGGILVALLAAAWTIRELRHNSPRGLLANILESRPAQMRRKRGLQIVSLAGFSLGLLLAAGGFFGIVNQELGFFGAGSLLLAALLSGLALGLRRQRKTRRYGRGWLGAFRLGLQYTGYRPGRSLLCVALIASATFVIVSVEAFRQDPERISLARDSGTGGFALFAESVLPWVHDLNSSEGLQAMNLSLQAISSLEGVHFSPFRLRPGDDASCLNLYSPRQPRILGAMRDFLQSGRFSFQDSLAESSEEKQNPWLLLNKSLEGGSVPAIGDANTIRYILHLQVGKELVVQGDGGKPVRLRLVGALHNSILQGELVISEENFLRHFPEQQGYRVALVDVAPEKSAALTPLLEEELSDFGFDVTDSRKRLASYLQVENTYLSTFQFLGGLGLVLGTIGLASILMRNVLERRSELTLLRAVGFRRSVLSWLVLSENIALIVFGLAAGTGCALVAVAPALASRGGSVPIASLGLVLGCVLMVGLAASLLATLAALPRRSTNLRAFESLR
jgi:ABC-type antimicrobial peptide transport system permease subunit